MDLDGEYSVVELDSASFPTDDPEFDEAGAPIPEEFDRNLDRNIAANAGANVDVADTLALTTTTTTSLTTLTTTPVEIAVMIVWTPRAESAAGGRSAMDALALNAVANANLVYANSGVAARLKLVYKAPVSYTETPSNISTDLNNLRGTTDGKMDQVHTLRNQYGADIVTLLGDGYSGVGHVRPRRADDVAFGRLRLVCLQCRRSAVRAGQSLVRPRGRPQPGDAAQSPERRQHAVAALRLRLPGSVGLLPDRALVWIVQADPVPFESADHCTTRRVTGTSSQDNARALNTNASIVAAFRDRQVSTASSTCSFSLSTTTLTFSASSGSKSISVLAPSGCAWTASESSGWIALNKTSGSGNGTVTVSVATNNGGSRQHHDQGGGQERDGEAERELTAAKSDAAATSRVRLPSRVHEGEPQDLFVR